MDVRGDVFLLNISGKDRPGLVAQLAGALAQYDVNILDIGQAVIHDYLALGILVEIPGDGETTGGWSTVMKELLFQAHELEVSVRYHPVPLDQYEHWVGEQGKSRHVITMMGRKLTAKHFAAVAAVCAEHGLNIDVITRLSGRVS